MSKQECFSLESPNATRGRIGEVARKLETGATAVLSSVIVAGALAAAWAVNHPFMSQGSGESSGSDDSKNDNGEGAKQTGQTSTWRRREGF